MVRAPSRVHTSITGGIIGGRGKRLEAAAVIKMEKEQLARNDKAGPDIKVAAGGIRVKDNDLDPAKVWNEAIAKGDVQGAHVIAVADFLFEAGEFKHAAEFLKASLRHGIVARPWAFEALAVALEAGGGDPEEIRRVRLSGIALDPSDASGFLSAARAMADRGQFERALAFCRQAALLQPGDYHSYEDALVYAENARDAGAMEWAAGNIVRQDWPVDNLVLQQAAKKRTSLAQTLKADRRIDEAGDFKRPWRNSTGAI